MKNPYDVLGVSQSATDEEIKKAYRTLSRKYHPDANVNNPNKAQAEERFKEVQQAYDEIMKMRQRGSGSNYSYGETQEANREDGYGSEYGGWTYQQRTWGGANNWGSGGRTEESPELCAAVNYIQNGYFKEALNVLNSMSERSSRWYYYSAYANAGAGNNVTAKEHAAKAVQMEPSNAEYRRLMEQLEYGGNWYQNMGTSYSGGGMNMSACCTSLCLMNIFCNLFSGVCFRPF